MKFANCTIKSKNGVSMVIAVALVSLTGIIALSIYTVALSRVAMEQKLDGNYKAQSLVNSALSIAQSRAKSVDAGFMQDWFVKCFDSEGGFVSDESECDDRYMKYKIESRATQINGNGNYFVPPVGQGSAGENCKYFENTTDSAMPCNWNRIKYGETVAIPLYTTYAAQSGSSGGCAEGGAVMEEAVPVWPFRRAGSSIPSTSSGTTLEVCNPVDLGLSSITMRFRTPCTVEPTFDSSGHLDPSWSASCSRPSLQLRPGATSSERSDVVVHWQVVGECDYTDPNLPDGQCSGVAVDGEANDLNRGNFKYSDLRPSKARSNPNIFDNENGVLAGDVDLVEFIRNQSVYASGDDLARTISNPVIQLSVVSPLTTMNNSQVPYLEYQIETNAPISDSNYTLYSVGKFNDFVSSFTKKIPITNAQLDLVLQN